MIVYDGHKVYMNGSYPAIWINNKNAHLHRYIWEKYFGKIPNGFIVHHKNENKLDWSIENLELLSRADHRNTHYLTVRRKGIPIIGIKNDEYFEFRSYKEASEKCGTYHTSIKRVMNGLQKQANGWKFYLKDGDLYSNI